MFIDFLFSVFKESINNDAIVFKNKTYNYNWVIDRLKHWQNYLKKNKIQPETVIALESDFSPNAVTLLLALIEHQCVIVPLTPSVQNQKVKFLKTAECPISFILNDKDDISIVNHDNETTNSLYKKLQTNNNPGLVLFSSGSTGESKAILHDFSKLLLKYQKRRLNLRTLTFLLFDHIGGIDTLFYSLSNGSCIIAENDRTPENICRVIEKFKVEVLPVSPSFLNLLLLSKVYTKYDLSSLKYITYGAEVMPENTLKHCTEIFPHITILQKYGTTEVGTLRSKSESSDSVWVKIGGEGYQTRIVNGILQIKAQSAMMGYLNAPSPFTNDGWFITGDKVEVKGDYYKILGRESDIINVGGEKVYPSEVENVIMNFENIADVTVFGEKNPILGNIVSAKISTIKSVEHNSFSKKLKIFCQEHLQNYKVPVKLFYTDSNHHTSRYKKIRRFH